MTQVIAMYPFDFLEDCDRGVVEICFDIFVWKDDAVDQWHS